jgi:hypothetical protein
MLFSAISFFNKFSNDFGKVIKTRSASVDFGASGGTL